MQHRRGLSGTASGSRCRCSFRIILWQLRPGSVQCFTSCIPWVSGSIALAAVAAVAARFGFWLLTAQGADFKLATSACTLTARAVYGLLAFIDSGCCGSLGAVAGNCTASAGLRGRAAAGTLARDAVPGTGLLLYAVRLLQGLTEHFCKGARAAGQEGHEADSCCRRLKLRIPAAGSLQSQRLLTEAALAWMAMRCLSTITGCFTGHGSGEPKAPLARTLDGPQPPARATLTTCAAFRHNRATGGPATCRDRGPRARCAPAVQS